MRQAGIDPAVENVKQFSQKIYKGMSRAAHHRRFTVDEAVDNDARTFIYGSDPREEQRLAFALYAAAHIHEVLLLVGDALSFLWGPTFYPDHLAPMLQRFDEVTASLDLYDFARRVGYV